MIGHEVVLRCREEAVDPEPTMRHASARRYPTEPPYAGHPAARRRRWTCPPCLHKLVSLAGRRRSGMQDARRGEVTQLLDRWRDGEDRARDALFTLVYDHVR